MIWEQSFHSASPPWCQYIILTEEEFSDYKYVWEFPGIQRLGLCALTARDPGSIPGEGIKIPQALQCSQKKKKNVFSGVRLAEAVTLLGLLVVVWSKTRSNSSVDQSSDG